MKNIFLPLRLCALLSLISATQGACTLQTAKPAQLAPEFSATPALVALNSEANVLTPGVVYELHEGGGEPILDILSRKPIYEPAGWIHRAPTDRMSVVPLAQKNAGSPTVRCADLSRWARAVKKQPCDVPTPVRVGLRVNAAASEMLLQPMTLVEILNRPMTGLLYNREAESRIQLWRSSLAAALFRHRADGAIRVALCLSRVLASEASLTVTGLVDAVAAHAIAVEVLNTSRVRIAGQSSQEEAHEDESTTYVFPVLGTVTLQTTFRDLQLVDGPIDSRIDFSLAGIRRISVANLGTE